MTDKNPLNRIDMEEYGNKIEQSRNGSLKETIFFILKEYKLAVYIAFIAGVAIFGSAIGNITLPPIVRTALQMLAIGIIPATLIGKILIVDRFMSKRMKRVMEYNPKDRMRSSVTFVPPPIWKNKKIDDLYVRNRDDGLIDADVKTLHYNKEENQLYVEGLPKDFAKPEDIATQEGKLDEVFNDAIHIRQKHQRLVGTLKSKHLDIQKDNINSIIGMIEKGTTLQNDNSMNFELDEDLEQFTPNGNSGSIDNNEDEDEDENENEDEQRKTLREIEKMKNGDSDE